MTGLAATPSRGLPERLFVVGTLFLASDALFPLLRAGPAGVVSVTQSDSTLETAWLAIYAVAVVLLVRRHERLLSHLTANRLLLAAVLIAPISAIWSTDPTLTLRRGFALCLTFVFAIYLTTAFSRRELGRLIAVTLGAIVVLSIGFAVLRPSYGLDHLRGGSWRGVFTTKNELGRAAALCCVVWLLRLVTHSGRALTALAVSALAAVAVVESGSRTAEVVLGLMVLVIALLPALRSERNLAVAAWCSLLAVTLVAVDWLVSHAGAVLTGVGADPTLTGRSEIWAAVWPMIRARPWVGYGYSGFWRGWDGPSRYVWNVLPFDPPHSHNGFIDVWLDLGIVGLALVVAALLGLLRRSVVEMRREWSFECLFPFVVTLFLIFYNATESALLSRNSLYWLLIVVAAQQVGQRQAHSPELARPPRPTSFGLRPAEGGVR